MNKNDDRKSPQRQNIQDDGEVSRKSGAGTITLRNLMIHITRN